MRIFLLRHSLAPIESAGEGDTQEWNLFDEFIHEEENKEGLLDRHGLSKMLDLWAFHKVSFTLFFFDCLPSSRLGTVGVLQSPIQCWFKLSANQFGSTSRG
jgi:hypothetical protein